ncbi:MAG TPA: ATP-grasp domain-containing protein [Solirubrobacteraceae bacterium]
MRICFLLVHRVPPVPNAVTLEAFEILRRQGFEVESRMAEEHVHRPDLLEVEHDLYVLKSYTEMSLSLAGALHARGARMLNPYPVCAALQNKVVTARLLSAAGIPAPRTWVTNELSSIAPLLEDGPLVVKPYLGHGAVAVRVVRDAAELTSAGEGPGPFVVQELVTGPEVQLKVYVIGEHAFGIRKPFSSRSFADHGRSVALDPDVHDIALRCGRSLGLGLYGLDVIETADGPVVIDVNYVAGYRGVPDAAALLADYVAAYARGTVELAPVAQLS